MNASEVRRAIKTEALSALQLYFEPLGPAMRFLSMLFIEIPSDFALRVFARLFPKRVLIVGSDDEAIEIARELLDRRHLGYRVVGFVDDDPQLQHISIINPRVIGTVQQCSELARKEGVTSVVVASLRRNVSLDALFECKLAGIRVWGASSYYERLTGKVMVSGLRKSWLVFGGWEVSRRTRWIKRYMDIIGATIGMLALAPLMILIALAIRLSSPGPVVSREEIVGQGRGSFILYKFRVGKLETDREPACNEASRLTLVGRMLRSTGLENLPWLWNVLLGNMSLVGPRPLQRRIAEELYEMNPIYSQRFLVKPGLTGWAQVKLRYTPRIEEELKYDLYYIKNVSIFLDVWILLSSVKTLFQRSHN